MSFEFVVLPVGAAASPGEVLAYVRAQQGIPGDAGLNEYVVEPLRLWNNRLTANQTFAAVRTQVDGSIVRVIPADRFERRKYRAKARPDLANAIRMVLQVLVKPIGYQVYDVEARVLHRP
ncbi:hypothetical protein [Nocardia sp. NPDC004722]